MYSGVEAASFFFRTESSRRLSSLHQHAILSICNNLKVLCSTCSTTVNRARLRGCVDFTCLECRVTLRFLTKTTKHNLQQSDVVALNHTTTEILMIAVRRIPSERMCHLLSLDMMFSNKLSHALLQLDFDSSQLIHRDHHPQRPDGVCTCVRTQ